MPTADGEKSNAERGRINCNTKRDGSEKVVYKSLHSITKWGIWGDTAVDFEWLGDGCGRGWGQGRALWLPKGSG
jgi:hypothetical protein